MSTLFFTDPHLGLLRTQNTTTASRIALRERINTQVVDLLKEADGEHDVVCTGDLFDGYSNKEAVISQGMEVVTMCDLVVGGNHDKDARADIVGSLEFIHEAATNLGSVSPIVSSEFGKPHCETFNGESMSITIVPHVTTQDLFDESISLALKEKPTGKGSVFVAHCNYESPYADTETTLNMTEGQAKDLLGNFDYIILGHEHQPRNLMGGRLIILGNTFPTGFSDISDKRIMVIDDDMSIAFHKIWDAKTGYLEVDHKNIPATTLANFMRVTGTVTPEERVAAIKAVGALQKTHTELYAVKLDIHSKEVSHETEVANTVDLPTIISEELKGTAAGEMWEEIKSNLKVQGE